MTYSADIQELRGLWATLFPGAPLPDDGQWALWLLRHDRSVVKQGIAELGLKFRKLEGHMDPEYMGKFASSVMNRIARELTSNKESKRGEITA